MTTSSSRWSSCLGVILTVPVGALLALKLTGTPFSASSGLGMLALIGVSVETAVILVSYINKLRLEQNMDIRSATREASLLRLRPIMMTALVACLGPSAGSALYRHRFGYAETFCHRHRCGPRLATLPWLLCQPCALPDGRPRR